MPRPNAKALILGMCSLVVVGFLVSTLRKTHSSISIDDNETRFVPDAFFTGQIVTSIIERETGPQRKLAVLIDLDRGEISTSPKVQPFIGSLSPGGRLDYPDCARAAEIRAPDGELAAYCTVKDGRYSVGIRNVKSGVEAREWSAGKPSEISGIIWFVDSKSIAVLTAQGRIDLDRIGLLSAASGHPIPLITFKVTLLSNRLDHERTLPAIRKDSPSGWARIDWIS